MSLSDSDRQSLRMQLVDEHVRLKNRHDLDGILTTFGAAARCDDEPWDAHYVPRRRRASIPTCCAPCPTGRSMCSGATRAKQRSYSKSSFAGTTRVSGTACLQLPRLA